MVPISSFVLGGASLQIAFPATHVLRLVNKFNSLISQVFFKLLNVCCISVELFVMLSFYGWGLSFYCPRLSQSRVQISKVPDVKAH